jgi:hypothetical protein
MPHWGAVSERGQVANLSAGVPGSGLRFCERSAAPMAYGDRKSERVAFERGIHVYIMGIDGTWRRDCLMFDVSQTGARLRIEGSFEGLDLDEFFLLLSSTGSHFAAVGWCASRVIRSASSFWRGKSLRKNPWNDNQTDETAYAQASRLIKIKDYSISDVHKITVVFILTSSTAPLTGIVQANTADAEMKFEITEDLAHKIFTYVSGFSSSPENAMVHRSGSCIGADARAYQSR